MPQRYRTTSLSNDRGLAWCARRWVTTARTAVCCYCRHWTQHTYSQSYMRSPGQSWYNCLCLAASRLVVNVDPCKIRSCTVVFAAACSLLQTLWRLPHDVYIQLLQKCRHRMQRLCTANKVVRADGRGGCGDVSRSGSTPRCND